MQSRHAIKIRLKKSLTKDEKIKLEGHMQSLGLTRKKQEDLDKCLSIESEQSANDEFGQLLIRAGANVNGSLGARGSCLHVAAKGGSSAMVAVLLFAGAKPNALNERGNTPLDSAMPRNTPNLLSYPEVKEKIRYLLENGADVNLPSPFYKTLFHVALLYSKSDELAMLIINNGLDIKYSSEEGTYLHCACEYSSEEVVQSLLDKGADINITGGRYNAVPFYYAIDNKKLSDLFLLKLLPTQSVEDAMAFSVFNRNKLYLQKACSAKRLGIIRFLLERSADPRSVQEDNANPFDDDVKRILAQSVSADYISEITAKMVLLLVRNFYHDVSIMRKTLTLEQISQLRSYILAALSTPIFMDKLGQRNAPYVMYMRTELVGDLQKAILSCLEMNKFTIAELSESIRAVIKLWEDKIAASEKKPNNTMEEQSPRDVSMTTSPRVTPAFTQANEAVAPQQLITHATERIYSTAIVQHTLYAPLIPPRPPYPPPAPPQDMKNCADNKNTQGNRVNDAAKDSVKDDLEMDIEVSSLKKGFVNRSPSN